MSTPFKNRLVGTIIVAAVVVIFLPDILDGEKKTYQDDFEAIPQAPKFSGEQTSKTFPSDKVIHKSVNKVNDETALDIINEDTEAEVVVSTKKVKVKNTTTQVTPAKPEPIINKPQIEITQSDKVTVAKVKPKPLPEKAVIKEAWVIHLGSFKHKKNVEQLINKLKANGYVVFTQPIETKQGTLTKVFIGPELIKSSLDKKLSSLKALTGTQGKVARFYPKS